MRSYAARYKEISSSIVCSTKFGRYPKISLEQVWNLIESDGWMVNFAGYDQVVEINPVGQGRGIYSSVKFNHLIAVIDDNVYVFDESLNKRLVGNMTTFTGDVFISENNINQIAISDLQNIYVYNYGNETFIKANINFTPGYITFQNGRFISPDTSSNQWRLSQTNDGSIWPGTISDTQYIGALQTKPDFAMATIRFPGRGNLLYVMGKTVTEPWYDIGAQLFPYQRSPSVNVDYGCLNSATIAYGDNIICWLAANESSGPVILYTNGGDIVPISTDGIDFKLAQLVQPENAYAFMFKQDGHLLYVITWPTDNITYIYDFNTKKFFNISDPNFNHHIAKRIAFFNNKYYFVSFIDGNLYELSSEILSANGMQIPRVIIPPTIRLPNQGRFVCGYTGFTIEEGMATNDGNPPIAQMAMAKDGNGNFGSYYTKVLNQVGQRQNRLIWWQLGSANDLTFQYRFYGLSRFVATNGLTGIYQ